MFPLFTFITLLSLLSNVLAFIQFVKPSPGAVLNSNNALEVSWAPADVWQSLNLDGVKYDLILCAGGDEEGSYEELTTLVTQYPLANSSSVSINIDSVIGGEYPNAYFLRMSLNTPDTLLNFTSPRFTLISMTGTFPASILSSLHSLPPKHAKRAEQIAAAAKGAQIPYPDQTGPTRYAPAPKQPGSTITAKTATPLFPSSSVKIATTFLPIAEVETTVSVPAEMTATSMENQAPPAPHPTDDMEKFLKRWVD